MHTGVKLDNLQCIAYRPAEKWKASPEFVRLLIISANSSVKKKRNSHQQSLVIRLNLESLNPSEKVQLYAYYGNDVIVPSDLRQYGVAKEEIIILPNHRLGKEYIIKNTEVSVLDRPKGRCTSTAERMSISKCVSNLLEKELNCSIRMLEGNQTMETCGPDLLQNFSKSGLPKIPQLSETLLYQYYGCTPSCSRNEIGLTMLNAYDRAKGNKTTLKLEFYFLDGGYEVKEEYYIYDHFSFLADCGGYIGLLLGSSCLSLYLVMAEWISKVVARNKIA